MTTTQAAPIQTRQPRRFSVKEYYAMADAGILTEKDRVELLDGEIILMAPIGSRHAFCVDQFNDMLVPALQGQAFVRIQNPVRLDDGSEPQPDIAVVRWRDGYSEGHPTPEDVLLLIEVADTTVDFDRNEKLALYARAGIPEVWIANLRDRRLETYTEPTGNEYVTAHHFEIGSSVSPQAFPDIVVPVGRIIPA